MLGMKTYTRKYIDQCRTKVDGDVASYRKFAAGAKASGSAKAKGTSGPGAFEATFFNNMVLVLDEMFVHRLRTVEGKDGNPLNEVRVLCSSMLLHNNIMTPDNPIKMNAEDLVLHIGYGDEIKLTEAGFRALSDAFFAEIGHKFS